jgi:heme-degrading monooxygenase HmoA
MYYDVIPEKAPLFLAKFREVMKLLEATPGHQATYLYQRVDDPHSYAILSEWNDAGAFQSFLRSDTFAQVTAWGREQVLRHAPRHRIYPESREIERPQPPP